MSKLTGFKSKHSNFLKKNVDVNYDRTSPLILFENERDYLGDDFDLVFK